MRFLRVLLPFLFVRNWYTGRWEISRHRLMLFGAFLVLFAAATSVVIMLQSPVIYISPH